MNRGDKLTIVVLRELQAHERVPHGDIPRLSKLEMGLLENKPVIILCIVPWELVGKLESFLEDEFANGVEALVELRLLLLPPG